MTNQPSPTIERLDGVVYEAIPDFEFHLEAELGTWNGKWGPFRYREGPERRVFWTRNVWLEPFLVHFASIGEAASALRAIQRNWAPSLFGTFRRGELIRSKLPPVSTKERTFPWLYPEAPMGAWTLLDEHTLLASARCASPFPGGILNLKEDKENPPSRAYLKLEEALTLARSWPQAGQRCLDAGACPGGWTWVLTELGARVTAVDRSPLDDRLMANPLVSFMKHDVFTLTPKDLGPMDWVFSDVICYPARLYEWVCRWLDSGLCRNMICTIKMQGEGDEEATRKFAEIPDSRVVHLHNNKHELCWINVPQEKPTIEQILN